MSDRYSISALVGRVKLIIGRGRISGSNENGPVQVVQVPLTALEVANLLRVGEFGFSSWPPDGTDAIAVFIAGDRSNGVVIATNKLGGRLVMENKGEAALHDAFGANGVPLKWFWLKKLTAELQAGNQPLNIMGASQINITPAAGQTTALNITTGGANVVLDAGGGNVTIKNPGSVILSDQNGEKAVVRDGDTVSAGVVHASQTAVKA